MEGSLGIPVTAGTGYHCFEAIGHLQIWALPLVVIVWRRFPSQLEQLQAVQQTPVLSIYLVH